jgi:hypothetical protein
MSGWRSSMRPSSATAELARNNAPDETLALYGVMGKVLEEIEDLNRAGKIAFDGDAAMRGKFNKDILLRARKGRAKKAAAAPPAGAAPPPT